MRPTRVSSHSATLIDHFQSNSNVDHHDTVIITSKLSDPFPVIYLSKLNKQKPKSAIVHYRDFSQANFLQFANAINQINWDILSIYHDTQAAYDYFSETFLSLFNMYFPVLSKKANKNNIPMNPWMSKGLLISRRQKILLCSKSLK